MKQAVTSGIGILAICRTGCSISVTAKLYPVKKGGPTRSSARFRWFKRSWEMCSGAQGM